MRVLATPRFAARERDTDFPLAEPLGVDSLFVPLLTTGRASPVDLRTIWTLDDVYDALEVLAVDAENQRRSYEEAERKAKQRR